MRLEICFAPGQADPEPTPHTMTNHSSTTAQKNYPNYGIERLELEISSIEVLNQFFKPGVTFSPPPPVPDEREDQNVPRLRKIGEGSRVTAFEVIGESVVLRKYYDELGRLAGGDFENIAHVAKGFAEYRPRYGIPVKVPEILDIPGEDSEYWKYYWLDYEDNISPVYWHAYSTPATKMSLMHSVPTIVRRALISQYHSRGSAPIDTCVVDKILNREENNHCLVHPCLGLEMVQRPRGNFTLRGFQLSLRDMENIGMDLENLTATLGDALAFLNFKCGRVSTLARFAFGASPINSEAPNGPLAICLYLHHFQLAHEDGGCDRDPFEELVRGMSKYIPDCQKTPLLWGVFKTAYIKRGNECRSASLEYTPEEVMKEYEEYVARKSS
ncbi:hypothetical protein FSARC_2091 [Fusarium sarcochroum]|uniref:Uncharacterized protein n=1 Tax=Fusarium sarcochroum TaxID=1208366 RepID=A0A8H4U7N5_9HYPO|nr:hypothetical protein FSARC_2091 [Fusarium sarcochroum]